MGTNMTARQRSWLKDNFIGLILLTMVGAYFTYDMQDKEQNRADHRKYESDISDLKAITSNLVETYYGKSEKDKSQDSAIDWTKEEILELWKCQKRSGNREITKME